MMKGRLLLYLMLLMQGVAAYSRDTAAQAQQAPTREDDQRVGLVLSGGGAKGIAEIGVIKVLEEHGIPIDYVTGTSMGAIVGGLYAAGYSPDDMMQLLESKMFIDASTGHMDARNNYLFFEPERRPTMLTVNINPHTGKMAPLLPSSLISPMPMNFAFMDIFAAYTAQSKGNFDNLFVPLRTVASDMTRKERKVWSRGQLSNAVRSSMTFPIVFRPIVVDSCFLYDGGIYDNFPVGVMRDDFHPDIMVGVDVHASDTQKGFPDVLDQMSMLVMRTSDYSLPDSDGVKLRVDLNKFSLLDFPKAREIYDIGYRHGMDMIDSISSRVTSRRSTEEVAARRRAFRNATPQVIFDSVSVRGASQAQNEYIRYIFSPKNSSTFTIDEAMDNYSKILTTGSLTDLEPSAVFNPETGHFNLDLEAWVKPDLALGFGGYVTSSSNSMLYLSGAFRSLSFQSMDASLGAWIGQSYMAAALDTRMMLRRKIVSSFGLQAVVWRQKFYESDKLFYEDSAPAFITNIESFVRTDYAVATSRHTRLDFGIGYGHKRDRFYNNNEGFTGIKAHRNTTMRDIGQLMVRWERTSIDDDLLPTAGSSIKLMGQGLLTHYRHREGFSFEQRTADPTAVLWDHEQSGNENWLQLEANWRYYFGLNKKWSLGIESTLLASTKHLMHCYNAAIVDAPAFNPTASSYNIFNPELHANSFVTAGLVPVFKFNDMVQIRGAVHAFLPFRSIREVAYGAAEYAPHWFDSPKFFAELSGVIKLPFANLTVFGSYQSTHGDEWGVGVSLGYFILAPRMLRL